MLKVEVQAPKEFQGTVVGQLNYSDRFANGPSTGRYELAHQITAYSKMISSSEDYVVAEILQRFFSKDDDFQKYLEAHKSELQNYSAAEQKKRGRPNKSSVAA